LILETNLEFPTTLKQTTTIGLEINKNPFILSGEGVDFTSIPEMSDSMLPSPYVARDFISKKNYLGLFIGHEIIFSDRVSLYFEGTFDIKIPDTSDLRELPTVEPIENYNFYPELSLDYQLTDNILLFTTVNYAAEPIERTDASNRPFKSEVYRGLELGIETELNDRWWATFSFYHETQSNLTTIDPERSDFELQINEQTSNSWTGEIGGEIIPGWWLYGFYSYTDATVTEDEIITIGNRTEAIARHSGGLWTSYEFARGIWRGLGFGGGIIWNGDRPGDATNSFNLPGYLQTDLAVFYSQNNFKVAISIQNLFNTGIDDDRKITPQTILGTALWEL
jgi:outer membrane receptor for ferric coprogen and ferric-rhodotorulic acid